MQHERYYIDLVERFIAHGEASQGGTPDATDSATREDPLTACLFDLMRDPVLRLQVTGSPVCAAVFRDLTLKFVREQLAEERFIMLRRQGRARTPEEREKAIGESRGRLDDRLAFSLRTIPPYLAQHGITDDEFHQCWCMMEGIWNERTFERIRRVVRLQRQYPQIDEVSRLMGRKADDDGKDRLQAASGTAYAMEHAAHSDIEGVGTGNDLGALLPMEMALCTDDRLSDLFAYKYLTRKLQTFRFKSEVLGPTRRLEPRPAKRKGPMVVCLDTSGSMSGAPQQLSHSLLIRLLSLAESEQRPLFLIAFAVAAHPIDVLHERARLMDFFGHPFTGDTNATQMMHALFSLLGASSAYINADVQNVSPAYINADVLWISDFKIPPVSLSLRRQFSRQRTRGTRFYSLQIGGRDDEEVWRPLFDRVVRI